MLPDDDTLLLIDAHAHIYGNYDLDKYLDAAFNNIRNASQIYGDSKKIVGVLCLTEGKNRQAFENLRKLADSQGDIGKQYLVNKHIDLTGEAVSLSLTTEQEDNIIIIEGRQIVTRENLEVLALGTSNDFKESIQIYKLIPEIVKNGAIPVVPWGFGKWIGKRGKLLRNIFTGSQTPRFFIGDNGNRLKIGIKHPLFRLAEKMKIKNLTGSDPLPLAGEYRRLGSYGVVIKGPLIADRPWEDLKQKLLDTSTAFEYYGKLESPLRFLRNQLAMQGRKRFQS